MRTAGAKAGMSALVAAMCLAGCSNMAGVAGARTPGAPTTSHHQTSTSVGTAPTTTTVAPTTTTTTRPPATTTTTTLRLPSYPDLGWTGLKVLAIQKRLTALGYWLGPDNGVFGDSTQQAVYAIQKAAGIERDGIVGPETERALREGVVPKPLPAPGYLIEVDLTDDLLMFVNNGKLVATLNCSTGGGYSYWDGSGYAIAETPEGVFHTFSAIDGLDVDSLGTLWRPRFFYSGFAIHGEGYVPPWPVSHGCVRVSYEAIDWIWADNLDPIGTEVWIFGNPS